MPEMNFFPAGNDSKTNSLPGLLLFLEFTLSLLFPLFLELLLTLQLALLFLLLPKLGLQTSFLSFFRLFALLEEKSMMHFKVRREKTFPTFLSRSSISFF